jgi:hypothetical protein
MRPRILPIVLPGLPNLRNITVEGSTNVTREGTALFPATVHLVYQ